MSLYKIPAASSSHLSTKLIRSGVLSAAAAPVLDALLARDVRAIDGGVPIFEQGEKPEAIEVIVEGWAIRERVLTGGRRQTVGILCGGDVCDFNVFMMARADSGCRAIGPVRVARIGRQAFNLINQRHPAVGQALWWETMAMAAVQREWVANLAARRAEPRIAGLMCMLFARMTLAGSADGHGMTWPFTQSDLAGACGLTPEHCNRTLGTLRKRGLIVIEDGRIAFPDPEALATLAEFDVSALHCDPSLLPFESISRHGREPDALMPMTLASRSVAAA